MAESLKTVPYVDIALTELRAVRRMVHGIPPILLSNDSRSYRVIQPSSNHPTR